MKCTQHLGLLALISIGAYGCGSSGSNQGSNGGYSGAVQLTITRDLTAADALRSSHGVAPSGAVTRISVHDLSGAEMAGADSPASPLTLSLASAHDAILVRARTASGAVLWAVAAPLSATMSVQIDLSASYVAAVAHASVGGALPAGAAALADQASKAVQANTDRLVGAARRIVDNAVLRGIDWAPATELVAWRVRAFGGGMQPVRALDQVVGSPQPELTPYLYARRILHPFLPSNIVVSELEAARWDYRVQGLTGHDGGPSVVSGGSILVLDSDRHCHTMTCSPPTLAIYRIDLAATGNVEPTRLTEPAYSSQDPALSPDESRIAFASNKSGSWEIWVMNADGSSPQRLTTNTSTSIYNLQPHWSPDGARIAFASDKSGSWEIWVMNADGSNPVQLTHNPLGNGAPSWSPDARLISFDSYRDGNWEIYVMNADGSNPVRITDNPDNDLAPCWAHDGIQVVYTSGPASPPAGRIAASDTLKLAVVKKLPDFALAAVYDRVIWAATDTVMLPKHDLITSGQALSSGYVSDSAGMERTSSNNPPAQVAYQTYNNSTDPLSQYRREIASCCPNFVPAPLTW